MELGRSAASHIDRILRGAKISNINLKAARATGLTVPPTVIGRADEVIE